MYTSHCQLIQEPEKPKRNSVAISNLRIINGKDTVGNIPDLLKGLIVFFDCFSFLLLAIRRNTSFTRLFGFYSLNGILGCNLRGLSQDGEDDNEDGDAC